MSEAFFIITVASDVQGLGSLCFCLLLPTFFLSLPGQHLGGFALEAPPPTLLPAPPRQHSPPCRGRWWTLARTMLSQPLQGKQG